MRVLILGSVVNDKSSGGVAVFDENLYHGFKKDGNEVNIVSIFKSSNIENIVAGKPTNSINKIYFRFRKIARLIKKYKPELVISSVQYSIGIKKYKRAWKNCTYVQVLHGVSWPINGGFKAWAINKVAKYSRKHFDKVVTVSYLSYALNIQINKIYCDKVIHNGCNFVTDFSNEERIYDAVYIGRLHPDKNVQMIADSFIELKKENPKFRFAIAGYGEEEELFKSSKYKNASFEFLGRISQQEVKKLLKNSKFFISMCPLETFGTTFNEAILSGCNIITQLTSGGSPLFYNKPYFHMANSLNKDELILSIKKAFDSYYKIKENDVKELSEYLDYSRVIKEYKELVNGK